MTLFPRLLLDALAATPSRVAFEHGSRRVSYGELLETVRRLVSGLRRSGLQPGSGVAMAVPLSPEGFAAHLAAYVLGGRVVGVRPGWTGAQLSGVLGTVDSVVVSSPVSPGPPTALMLDDLLRAPDQPIQVAARSYDIARVNFTSGSTGRPKGCAWTYASLTPLFDPAQWPPDLARLVSHFSRCLVYGTFSMPVMMTFAGRSLLTGGTVVIAPSDVTPLLPDAISRYGITGTVATVPALHRMLALAPLDLPSLGALVVTGSPVSAEGLAAALDLLGPVVWQGYGASESGMISLLTPSDVRGALTSVGRPLPHVEISVRSVGGGAPLPLPRGEIGEIFVRSPHMMAGYWDDPKQTAEVLRNGWLNTRDLGYLDETGLLHLTGRTRDVIMVEAEIRYAAPIERILTAHPDVDQAYVIGAPDSHTGEAIHAFVVPHTGRTPDPQTLATLIHTELGPISVPKTITTIPTPPLTTTGKPDKQALINLVSR